MDPDERKQDRNDKDYLKRNSDAKFREEERLRAARNRVKDNEWMIPSEKLLQSAASLKRCQETRRRQKEGTPTMLLN